jgi:hypothetical protein
MLSTPVVRSLWVLRPFTRLRNRGASSANDVQIVGVFSDGIEPAQDASYTVENGRVSFPRVQELPASRDFVLRIRAHALRAGTHKFRAEMVCRDPDIKLVSEVARPFYADDPLSDSQSSETQSADRSKSIQSKVR